MNHHHQTIDHLFRHESGKMISVLSRLLGMQHLDAAQDIVQDTLVQAMTTWPYKGMPENPSAWLYRVAKNKAIDFLRREKTFRNLSPEYGKLLQSEYTLTPTIDHLFEEDAIKDSQLRMIFTCCHPAIALESQVAFALKTLCGLNTAEIAKAFLTTEETVAKRIYRAKEKIRAEALELELPSAAQLPERLDAVLRCLYLLFNEGYNSSHPDQLIREDLCEEAIRLGYLLTLNKITDKPRTNALLSLLCFQASRLKARIDEGGDIILLKNQDREKWFRPLMQKGFYYLQKALTAGYELSTFHLEAAIASLHANAASFEETDWTSVYALYKRLYQLQPGPIVALNRAIAASYAESTDTALQQMLSIDGLDTYYIFHASLGELYFELGEKEKARQCYEKAAALTNSRQEQQLLKTRIRNCLPNPN